MDQEICLLSRQAHLLLAGPLRQTPVCPARARSLRLRLGPGDLSAFKTDTSSPGRAGPLRRTPLFTLPVPVHWASVCGHRLFKLVAERRLGGRLAGRSLREGYMSSNFWRRQCFFLFRAIFFFHFGPARQFEAPGVVSKRVVSVSLT